METVSTIGLILLIVVVISQQRFMYVLKKEYVKYPKTKKEEIKNVQ